MPRPLAQCQLLLFLVAPACNALFGIDALDYGGTATGGQGAAHAGAGGGGTGGVGGVGGVGGAAGQCAIEQECVPLPDGFDGVATLVTADGDGTCPGGMEKLLQGGVDPNTPAASCTPCSCAAAEGVVCPSTGQVERFGDSSCTNGAASFMATDQCAFKNFVASNQSVKGTAGLSTGGSCPAQGGDANGAAPSFGAGFTLCALGEGSCGAGACVDRAQAAAACLYSLTGAGCPTGYAETVLHGGFDDQRGCTPCTCTVTPVQCVPTTKIYFSSNDCTGTNLPLIHDGGCWNGFNLQGTISYKVHSVALADTPGCTAAGGEANGEVKPTGTVTVCCP